jgi:hypothetical protein
LLARALSRGLSRTLDSSLSGVSTEVLIRLENPTANASYSLDTDFVVGSSQDFAVSGYFVFDNDEGHLFSDTNGFSRIAIFDGDVFAQGLIGSLSSTAFLTDNKQHFIYISRIAGSFVFKVDGVTLLTASNTDSFTINAIAQIRGQSTAVPRFAGNVSQVSLTHITTPANSLFFELNNLTANTEVNNGVTLTYNNIATTTDVRNTYTLSNGGTQWISNLRTIDIAAQA